MRTWHQANVVTELWEDSERTAAAHLAPLMINAEKAAVIDRWFIIRKHPAWRLRYRLTDHAPQHAVNEIGDGLADLLRRHVISRLTEPVYEPEERAFGGPEAMDIAHTLFHVDSRHLLAHLADPAAASAVATRRTLAVLLCTAFLRGAGLDWYEQGDVWHRVTDHRPLPATADPARLSATKTALATVLTVDTDSLAHDRPEPAQAAAWRQAFATAGDGLAALHNAGRLHRGLRDVAAHHVLFAWNRHGVPAGAQAVLARSAADAVFGPDPTAANAP